MIRADIGTKALATLDVVDIYSEGIAKDRETAVADLGVHLLSTEGSEEMPRVPNLRPSQSDPG